MLALSLQEALCLTKRVVLYLSLLSNKIIKQHHVSFTKTHNERARWMAQQWCNHFFELEWERYPTHLCESWLVLQSF
jgi:hypothetical protein